MKKKEARKKLREWKRKREDGKEFKEKNGNIRR